MNVEMWIIIGLIFVVFLLLAYIAGIFATLRSLPPSRDPYGR